MIYLLRDFYKEVGFLQKTIFCRESMLVLNDNAPYNKTSIIQQLKGIFIKMFFTFFLLQSEIICI